tara:strand:- start:1556 stop:1702 length:147 start_codon:yes stop_codon:yes gene_type:complete
MEEEISLKSKFFAIVFIFFLSTCGIKGTPVPPVTYESKTLSVSVLEIK